MRNKTLIFIHTKSGRNLFKMTTERKCPGKWPWACCDCPEYLKKGCSTKKESERGFAHRSGIQLNFHQPGSEIKYTLNQVKEIDDRIYAERKAAKIEMCELIRKGLSKINDESCCGEMNSEKCYSYENNCTLCKFDKVVESLHLIGVSG